jgi:PAS domain S-box-containing protein
MRDRDKTKLQLLTELEELRRRVAELEALERERRQTEKTRRDSEERYRLLAEHAQDLIYRYRLAPTPGFEYVSSSSTAITGYTPEEHYADPDLGFKLLHPDDRPLLQNLTQPSSFEKPLVLRWRRKDGRLIWTEQNNVPIHDDQGNLIALEGLARDITDRKLAEEALRASEARYRSLFARAQRQAQELTLLDQVRTAVARELDLPYLFQTVVKAVANTFGYTQVSLYMLQDGVLKLQHQVGYNHVIGRIPITQGISGRVARTGQPVLLKDVRTDPDFLGAIEGIVSEVCVPLFDRGQVAGALNVESTRGVELSEDDLNLMTALGQEISIAIERARLYTEARTSEQFLQAVFDGIQDGISVLDNELNVVRVNRTMERRYPHALPLSGKKCFAVYHGRSEPCEVCPTRWALESRMPQMNQVPLTGPSGVEGWLELHAFPLLDADGRPTGVIEYVRDITERKQAEDALRNSREQLALIMDGVPALMAYVDSEERYLYVNKAYADWYGHAREDFIGMRIRDLLDEQVYQRASPYYKAALSGRRVSFENKAYDKDWRERFVSVNFVPHFDDTGSAKAFFALIQDITERKRTEEALRQSNLKLQARNEELDAFAQTVAHDLKAPLSHITGYADLLRSDYAVLPDDEKQRILRAIEQNGRKMGNIIDELLLLAEVRKADAQRQPLDMAGVIAEAQQRVSGLVEAHHAIASLPDHPWPVALGYAPWIEEVWVNYISNAVKYGGRPPRIELGAELLPDGMARFWVRDNGRGIAPEDQRHLFTPFTRLDQIRARGHGLGLSIVRRIVEKLGGQVGVESQVGQGSTFYFTLPGAVDTPAP